MHKKKPLPEQAGVQLIRYYQIPKAFFTLET